jgi:hypothetical protein
MEEKKIATSVEVLIRVADFESIRIAKYGETKITYESTEEMVRKENELNAELVDDLVRNMRSLPEKLGKRAVAPVAAIEDKIQKKIPEWLANNPIPNLAKDASEKGDMQAANKVEAKKEKEASQNDEVAKLVEPLAPIPPVPEPVKPVEKPLEKVPEKKIDLNADDLFGDDDLFK